LTVREGTPTERNMTAIDEEKNSQCPVLDSNRKWSIGSLACFDGVSLSQR
jgi:hypothetical protein